MGRPKWIVLVLALVAAIAVSGQDLGKNYGINLRLHQRGLDYGTQKAVDEFYNEFRNKPIPEFSGSSGRTSYRIWNIRIPELSKPSFQLRVNAGQGVTAILRIAHIKITGEFRVRYKQGWFKVRKTDRFTTTVGSVVVNTLFGAGRDSSGRPTTQVRSCNSHVGSLRVNIHTGGVLGSIIDLLEKRISRTLKDRLSPLLCQQIIKVNNEKLNPSLRKLKVSTEVQDPRLRLDYSLLRAPEFASNYIDTTFKADVSWKGRTTNTETARRPWPVLPGTESRMVTIFITDYIMNALGYLLHNDGVLSYNVTRNQVSGKVRPRLALSCPGDICSGTFLPELAQRYPDGWLEAGIRTSSPPRLTFHNDFIRGDFNGVMEAYVARPNGDRIRVASLDAGLLIPLSLNIVNNKIIATLRAPNVTVQGVDASTQGMQNLLSLISTGFTNIELEKIGRKGIDLPEYDGVTLVRPQIFVRENLIVVSTDINYNR